MLISLAVEGAEGVNSNPLVNLHVTWALYCGQCEDSLQCWWLQMAYQVQQVKSSFFEDI